MDIGRVIKILNDNMLIIVIDSKGDCESCQNKFSCNVFSKEDKTIEVKTDKKFNIGDRVKVEFQPKYKIIASIIVFFIPLISLFIFYQIGMILLKNEAISAMIGIIGLIACFSIIALIFKIKSKSKFLSSTIIKIDDQSE